METDEPVAFGVLLSRYRVAAGWTQEELAERARLSVEAISTIERGLSRRPRSSTVQQLLEALHLSPEERTGLERVATAGDAAPHVDDPLPPGDFLGAQPTIELVARDEEMIRLRAALDAVTGGTAGHVLFLSGEVGVGKTRLLQELMTEARARGCLVLAGRCRTPSPASPLYPLLDTLSGLSASLPVNARGDWQRHWKQIRSRIAAMPPQVGTGQGAVAQHELLRAVADGISALARSVPVVLLLDDLPWADHTTLELLQHLAHTSLGSPILLAATFRDLRLSEEHPNLAEMLQSLSRERLAERITVRRLSLEETTALAAVTMDHEQVSEEFAHFVYRRTKGVPRLIDQLVRSLGGRLELQGEIGAGSMGRVFRAFDRVTERTVAAKLVLSRTEIDLDTLLRFQQEGAVLARLDHPHIVDIYDTFVEEHASCIVMELLEGQSLGQLLHGGPLPLERAKHLAQQVAEALSYAHAQSIVHRDIKPDNVMVLDGDQVKATDFGIARVLQPDTSLGTIATTGMRMGTPLYMAPEQIEGKKIDGRTDIYALGAMLYHMVTGRPPFEGSDALAVAVKHLQEEPVPPSQIDPAIPADWDALILKAMAKDPAKRFQSAREMEDALGALGDQAARRPLPVARSRRIAALAGSLALVAAVLVGVWAQTAMGSQQASAGSRIGAYLRGLGAHGQFSGSVLVAKGGTILLDKGYGLADRKDRVPNSPTTKYPVEDVSFSIGLAAALKLEEQGKLHDRDRVCSFLSSCPPSWKSLTIRMVLAGTSGLGDANWGRPGHTTVQSLAYCQAEQLTPLPHSTPNYQSCTIVVLGAMIQRVAGEPWTTVMRRLVLEPSGMTHSGRVIDSLRPPVRAEAYSGSNSGDDNAYNDYFQLYSTAQDVYGYDRALFGGRLLSKPSLDRLFASRAPVEPPDSGVDNARVGSKWKIGSVFGHRVIYTTDNSYSFTAANFQLPDDDVTIVVISNDEQNDVEGIAVHLAGMVVPKIVARVSPTKRIMETIKVPGVFGLPSGDNSALWVGGYKGVVTRIDPGTNKVVATININDPTTRPGLIDAGIVQVATGSGQVWVSDRVNKTVVHIDPATNEIVARLHVGIEPFGLAIAGDTLWVGDSYQDEPGVNTFVRIDLRTQKMDTITNATTNLGEPFLVMAANRDALWYADWEAGTIKRLDPATNKVVASIHAGLQPSSVTVGDGAVWTANHYSNQVTRIDPATNKAVATIRLNGYPSSLALSSDCCGGNIAVGAGGVWAVVGSANRTLVRIDPRTKRVTASHTFSQTIGPTAFVNGSVWVEALDKLYRIDPAAMKGT